jgi:hypothetical protein
VADSPERVVGYHVGQAFQPDSSAIVRLESLTDVKGPSMTNLLRIATLLILSVACLSSTTLAADEAPAVVTVVPQETDEILANPGMGWETFHRTSRQDKNLPAWLPSTVHYLRWGWAEVEPQPGQVDETMLNRVLKESRDAGQKLAFRVMCCSTTLGHPYHPSWLKDVGGKELQADYEGRGPFPIPDMDDPIVLQRHLDLIRRLGQRYDGHPDIDHVDLGSVGWWGEWHLSGSKTCKLPTLENRKKIVDAYLAAFKKTPLVMLVGGGELLTYATQHGAGWRADCLGDMGGFSKNWCHMRKGYPVWIRQSGIQDTWKATPVAWESCWDMRKWVAEGWPLRYIFNYALALHGSYLNNKSAPLPEGENVRPEVERFLRRLGYRLVLKQLQHPRESQAGQELRLTMKWQNLGSAPCYRPYRLAYQLTGTGGFRKTLVSQVTVNRWLPGSIDLFTDEFFQMPQDLPPGEINDVADSFRLPADLPPGRYTLAIGVVDQSGTPVVRLGIQGRRDDGWYPLSALEVAVPR